MNEKNKIVIIQLTRIGDLIQTLQATRQLKAEKPNLHISLVARKKFAKGICFLLETVFDEIILFDTQDFFIEKTLTAAKSEVHSFIKKLNATKYDYAINLSFTKSSSYLNTLIDANEKYGLQRNASSEIVINDKWSQYIFSNTMNHAQGPFNLVDLYRYILGVSENLVLDPDPNFLKRDNNIVLHPFASQRKKKWGMNKWNELIYKLAKDNSDYHFHIVGGPEDKAEAQRLLHSPALAKIKNRITNSAGKYSIAQVYQLLNNARLFIGHDSMVSHLASETLTPSIVISLGTVRPAETTPYSDKVVNVAPKNKCYPCQVSDACELLPCHSSISYQVISVIANGLIDQKVINKEFLLQELTSFQLNTIKVYTSSYSDDGINLKEISENYATPTDVFKNYFKIIWLYYLRGIETQSKLPQITYETAKELNNYTKGINYLYELYNFGVKYSNMIIESSEAENIDLEEIQKVISKIGEIDELCSITKKNYPLLKGLVDFFYVNKANAPGNNLIEISKHNLLNYYDASNLVAVLSDFIDRSVRPYIDSSHLNKDV